MDISSWIVILLICIAGAIALYIGFKAVDHLMADDNVINATQETLQDDISLSESNFEDEKLEELKEAHYEELDSVGKKGVWLMPASAYVYNLCNKLLEFNMYNECFSHIQEYVDKLEEIKQYQTTYQSKNKDDGSKVVSSIESVNKQIKNINSFKNSIGKDLLTRIVKDSSFGYKATLQPSFFYSLFDFYIHEINKSFKIMEKTSNSKTLKKRVDVVDEYINYIEKALNMFPENIDQMISDISPKYSDTIEKQSGYKFKLEDMNDN